MECLLPPISWTKVNSDGSHNSKDGIRVAGFIFYNSDDQFIFVDVGGVCCNSVLDAEIKASQHALTKAVERQFDFAILETDLMLLTNILKRKTEICWKKRAIFTDCFHFDTCSFYISHIPRESKQVAD